MARLGEESRAEVRAIRRESHLIEHAPQRGMENVEGHPHRRMVHRDGIIPVIMTKIAPVLLIAMILFASYASSHAAGPIAVMLIDGESGGPWHKWTQTTPVLKKELEDSGLFKVDVVTAPATTGELTGFKPSFSNYRVVVMNYDAPDERWPADLKTAFEQYVSNGGGVVIVHAADNAFPG